MAKKKPTGKPDPKPKDRHKPRKMMGLPPRLHRLLKAMADKNKRPITWELRRLVEEAAENMGIPVPPAPANEEEETEE